MKMEIPADRNAAARQHFASDAPGVSARGGALDDGRRVVYEFLPASERYGIRDCVPMEKDATSQRSMFDLQRRVAERYAKGYRGTTRCLLTLPSPRWISNIAPTLTSFSWFIKKHRLQDTQWTASNYDLTSVQ